MIKFKDIFKFPNILTLTRLILSPLFLPLLLVYFLPINSLWINSFLGLIFLLFSLTDFFDGFLARKYSLETKIGRIIDPIADKSLLFSTLIALLAAGKIYFYWVVLLIGREIFLMGLRIFALEHKLNIKVSFWGKLKTLIQTVYVFVAIVNPYQYSFFSSPSWNVLELALLAAALFVSLYSAYLYYNLFIMKFNKSEES